ncbi:hypothetical protein ABGN05_06505 [Aquibium sp. LZ166]|uniref:Uncharacterized protein n=1 Tax=Aquibium pacificus TaxID=3153579 RepID=A0ABV3SF01_9HYPH
MLVDWLPIGHSLAKVLGIGRVALEPGAVCAAAKNLRDIFMSRSSQGRMRMISS